MTNPNKKFEKTFQKWQQFREEQIAYSEKAKADIIARIPAVLRKYQVKKAILFGSVLANQADERSDVDLLVYPLPKDKFWELNFELREALEMPIDLHTDDEEPVLVKKIISRGEMVYEA